jgi:tRNA(fMet)-specific endonuclease VapC
MEMIVADSDVLIDFLRGREPMSGRIESELRRGIATTAISAFELWAGSSGSTRKARAIEDLLDSLHILPLDAEDAHEAAEIKRDLERKGKPIGMADCLIAGVCIRHKATLLTRNREHFSRVGRLMLAQE